MEGSFSAKEIVWAKVKGYPWWPAEISKIPTPENNVFKVVFIAEETHAFLHPKDVRKYNQFYDECSKKKMKGLPSAIQIADQLHLKRIEAISKVASTQDPPTIKKTQSKLKQKQIKKITRKAPKSEESESEENHSEVQEQVSKQQPPEVSIEKEESSPVSEGNLEEDKFMGESSDKIDRNKLDSVETALLKVVEKVKDNSYTFRQADFCNLDSLNSDELLLGRITNMLNFIITKLPKSDSHQIRWLRRLKEQLKQRVLDHLYDTSYYDQYIKLIEKNKKNRSEYQNKIMLNLKTQYRLKKELAVTFASRLMTQINNGTIARQKELLDDIRERRIDIVGINNKAAIDRCIENIMPKYM